MSLQDPHLQQALKNAPDRDMTPSDATRTAVLVYAEKAVKPKQSLWPKHMASFLKEWLGSSWRMAGVGSAVATVLVVIVFWHNLPDDTMRKISTASEYAKISATDSAVEPAPEAASAEKPLIEVPPVADTPLQESSASVSEHKITLGEMPRKAKLANSTSPTIRETLTKPGQPALKNSRLPEAIQQTAPAATEPEVSAEAPAPASIEQDKAAPAPAPVAVARSVEASSVATKDGLSKELQAESDASLKAPREKKVTKKLTANADILGASAPKGLIQDQETQALLAKIKNEGGKSLANQDIQTGNLRLLKVDMQSKDLGTLNCPQIADKVIAVDAVTGYEIHSVASCDATDSLLQEVEIYNQTMRDWHSNHSK